MKLYFAPGACSLSPHIVLREAGAKFDLEQVDLREKKTKKGDDYWTINPKGQVPLLELDDGQMISEGPAIAEYVADKNPGAGIIPAAGSIDRYHLQGWLTHIGTELHKTYGPMSAQPPQTSTRRFPRRRSRTSTRTSTRCLKVSST